MHSDAFSEFDAVNTYYRNINGKYEEISFLSTQDGNDLIPLDNIQKIVENGKLDEEQKVDEFRKILAERTKLPKNRGNEYDSEIIEKRIRFLEDYSEADLSALGDYSVDPSLTKGNIENIIGFTQVPIGAIGPLSIHGEFAEGDYFVPFATLEGALVSSYNRGSRVVSLAGGVNVVSLQDTIQRSPFFVLSSIKKAKEFILTSRFSF